MGLTMLLPLMPFYARAFGASAEQVGALMSVYALFSLISGPPLGSLSDRHGRKPVLLASQFGTFLGLILMAFAPNLWILFLARIIDGATAGNITVAQAYMADISRPSERAKSFGFIGIAFGIGFLIGPASTAFIAAHYGDRAAVLAAAALSMTSILATLFLLPRHPPRPEPEPGEPVFAAASSDMRRASILDFSAYAAYFRRPNIAPLLWQFFAFQMCFSIFMGGFALYAERRFGMQTSGVSYALAYAGLLGIFVQGFLIQRLLKAFGESRLLVIGFLAAITSMLLLGFASSPSGLYAGITALSLTGFLRPVISSLLSRRTSPQEQGAIMGLTQSLSSISQILGPLLAGVLIGRGMLTGWGIAAAGIAAVGLILQRSAHADVYSMGAAAAAAAAAAGSSQRTTTNSR